MFTSRMAEAVAALVPLTWGAAWFVNPTLGYWVGGVVGTFAVCYFILFAAPSWQHQLDDAFHDGRGVRIACVATVVLSACLVTLYTLRPTPAARFRVAAWIVHALTSQLPKHEENVTTKPEQLAAVVEPVPNPFDEMNETLRTKDEALRNRDEKIADLQIELEVMKRVQSIMEAQRTAPATAAASPAAPPAPPVLDLPPTSAQVTIEVASAGRLDEPTPPPIGPSEQQPRTPVPQPVSTAPVSPSNLRLLAQ